MTNKRNNKASGTSAPKRPAQSPPSGNVQGQGSSASTSGLTSQPLTDNSAKRTRVSSEPVMDQDNILTPPALQDNTSTSSPPPVDTNASPSAPDSGTSLDDSQHSPSNSADKGKSVDILPPEPERAASPDASTAAIQSSLLRFYAAAAPSTIEGFWTYFKTNREACDATDREFSSFSSYVFDSATSLDQFDTTWAVICTGHCLRVCPASHSPDQRAIRRAHVALLAGLLRSSVAADLSEIAKEVSAKSVNIPFSYNSYNPKPYAYVHFSSAATKESAMGITCALKSIGLTWHELTEVSSLCHRCGHPGCHLDKCASSRAPQRPSRPWSSNDKLRELYNKHLPPSHPAKRHNRFARPANSERRSYADAAGRRVPSRSQSHPRSSRSRSRPNNHRHPHRPSQSDLDHDIAAMDVPPLMDWQHITEQITIILEEITHLTTEFAQLLHRVKWLEDQHSSSPPPIPSSQQPQAPLAPEIDFMNQGWDNIEPFDPRRLSDNLMDFSSPVSPSNGPNFTAHSHIPLSPRMSLIPGPASSPQDCLSSLTTTVTELTKTIQQGMAQQKQFLAARDNANSQ
ncbi:hypothetical protein GLOIN_2v1785090 [Rhizophagus irregularis DAOM 181602=DAOM 197198]|nr:hypothetical protein GLOIN_2v1785090 [Rhizophagus irregularis DAOM 181602=DAOM 197198]